MIATGCADKLEERRNGFPVVLRIHGRHFHLEDGAIGVTSERVLQHKTGSPPHKSFSTALDHVLPCPAPQRRLTVTADQIQCFLNSAIMESVMGRTNSTAKSSQTITQPYRKRPIPRANAASFCNIPAGLFTSASKPESAPGHMTEGSELTDSCRSGAPGTPLRVRLPSSLLLTCWSLPSHRLYVHNLPLTG